MADRLVPTGPVSAAQFAWSGRASRAGWLARSGARRVGFIRGLGRIDPAHPALLLPVLAAVGFFARLPAGHFYLGRPHLPSHATVEIPALDLGPGAAIHLRDSGAD